MFASFAPAVRLTADAASTWSMLQVSQISTAPAADTFFCGNLQVLQTNKRISKAGQTVWTHTKRQTDRALGPPKALLKRLHRGSQEAADDSDEDVEGRSLPDYRWASRALWAPGIIPTDT